MKYAVTGHTYGIGEGLYNRLSPDVIGFSKPNGYDITKKEDRQRIIYESKDCSIFINNATDQFGQSELLLDLWHEWKDQDKIIINVGSRIAEDKVVLDLEYSYLLGYSMYKRTLKQLSLDLMKIDTPLQVKYCWFGYVNVPHILKKYPHFTEKDYITVEAAVDIILSEQNGK
jgi:hypothetical protein